MKKLNQVLENTEIGAYVYAGALLFCGVALLGIPALIAGVVKEIANMISTIPSNS